MDVEAIKDKVAAKVEKYFESQGYDKDEIREDGLYNIDVQENNLDGYIDLYLYAEISVEEFLHLADKLNAVVEKYDQSTYFDIHTPGVYTARIYVKNLKSSKRVKIGSKDLKAFGAWVMDEVNDNLHFSQVEVESTKVDGSTLKVTVVKDGMSRQSGSIELDPTEDYSYNTLVARVGDDIVNQILDKILV